VRWPRRKIRNNSLLCARIASRHFLVEVTRLSPSHLVTRSPHGRGCFTQGRIQTGTIRLHPLGERPAQMLVELARLAMMSGPLKFHREHGHFSSFGSHLRGVDTKPETFVDAGHKWKQSIETTKLSAS